MVSIHAIVLLTVYSFTDNISSKCKENANNNQFHCLDGGFSNGLVFTIYVQGI